MTARMLGTAELRADPQRPEGRIFMTSGRMAARVNKSRPM